jgi:hypothetical protein
VGLGEFYDFVESIEDLDGSFSAAHLSRHCHEIVAYGSPCLFARADYSCGDKDWCHICLSVEMMCRNEKDSIATEDVYRPFPRTRDMFRASELVFRQAGLTITLLETLLQDTFASRPYFRKPRNSSTIAETITARNPMLKIVDLARGK